jgi:16S rRNA (uracil1498-N3)-methyltransferase
VNDNFTLFFIYMALPFFYKEDIDLSSRSIVLDEDTGKHVVQVLRMQVGEQLQLTDGKGNLLTVEIADNNKKKCVVTVLELLTQNPKFETRNISIAISLTKNNNRFEWFLEKATELGVSEIIPLICERTEKEKFRLDRMKNILVSAMLQSQQRWLPVLHEPVSYDKLWQDPGTLPKLEKYQQKFIAHCIQTEKRNLTDMINENLSSKIILIGPEGDFAAEEVQSAIDHHFIPVALGSTRLRTETAGIVAATLLCLV